MTKRLRPDQFPPWYDGQSINEAAFCREFLASHKLLYTENSFFTPEGRMTDEAPLKTEIYQIIEPYASTSVPKKIANIIELLKITAHIDDFPPQTDRIHVANGTLFLDGSFSTAIHSVEITVVKIVGECPPTDLEHLNRIIEPYHVDKVFAVSVRTLHHLYHAVYHGGRHLGVERCNASYRVFGFWFHACVLCGFQW